MNEKTIKLKKHSINNKIIHINLIFGKYNIQNKKKKIMLREIHIKLN